MHRFRIDTWADLRMSTDHAAVTCEECSAVFGLEVSVREYREMLDPQAPWRLLSGEMRFLDDYLPCTYPEAATG